MKRIWTIGVVVSFLAGNIGFNGNVLNSTQCMSPCLMCGAKEQGVRLKFEKSNNVLLDRLDGVYEHDGVNCDDYYVKPIVGRHEDSQPIGPIKKGSVAVWGNHRGDRSLGALDAFTLPGSEFNKHGNRFDIPDLELVYVPFANYDPKTFKERGIKEAFKLQTAKYLTLSEILSEAGVIQARFAESDKGKHITYFFDGGVFVDYEEKGIHVEIIPGEKVEDKHKKPQMKCAEITEKVIAFMEANKHLKDKILIVVNYALDIQGHNLDGDKQRAIKAVLATDQAVGRLREKVKELGGVLVVTADHGNVEEMAILDKNGIPLRDKHGIIFSKQHTVENPVPFIIEGLSNVELKKGPDLGLANIAPTLLDILGVEKPQGMVESLLESYEEKQVQGPVVLVIRDGWGIARFNNPEANEYNAVRLADPPIDKYLTRNCPSTLLRAHGKAVGLPYYQMGDSDNGHKITGAAILKHIRLATLYGDIIQQIEDGSFEENTRLLEAFKYAIKKGEDIHYLGLISSGGVHSDYRYVLGILRMLKNLDIDKAGINFFIHAILDGRDVQTRIPTQRGSYYLREILKTAKQLGLKNVGIADASGRNFGMDRDAMNRDKAGKYEESRSLWGERFRVAYEAWVYGKEAVEQSAPVVNQALQSGLNMSKIATAV